MSLVPLVDCSLSASSQLLELDEVGVIYFLSPIIIKMNQMKCQVGNPGTQYGTYTCYTKFMCGYDDLLLCVVHINNHFQY